MNLGQSAFFIGNQILSGFKTRSDHADPFSHACCDQAVVRHLSDNQGDRKMWGRRSDPATRQRWFWSNARPGSNLCRQHLVKGGAVRSDHATQLPCWIHKMKFFAQFLQQSSWNIRSLICRETTWEDWHPFILDSFGCAVSMPSWVASGTMAGVGRASAISARQASL